MRQGLLSRDQVVALVGESVINDLGKINCEPTSRLGVQGYPDDWTEWTASISPDGGITNIIAYYYTSNDQDQIMADNDGDGSSIIWQIEGYEIV